MTNTNKNRSKGNVACIAASLAALGMIGLPLAGGMAGCKGALGGVSKSQEIQMGQQAAQQVDAKSRFITSGPEYDRLQRVAGRIFPLARKDYDVPFSIKLIDSKEINAFALPGGPIYFYSGLMDLASSDDEVASVLGHEATHIVKRHSVKQIADAQTKGLIAQIALGKSSNMIQALANIGLQLDQLHFSRNDEAQADENGFRYLTQAGYNPEAMSSFFRKMGAKTGTGGTEFLSNHPLTKKRIAAADERARAYEQTHGIVGSPTVQNSGNN